MNSQAHPEPGPSSDGTVEAGQVLVRVDNTYSDGHSSSCEVTVAAPETGADIDGWWLDTVGEHTGDGHGAGRKLGYCHTATVIAAADPELVGLSYEWCGY